MHGEVKGFDITPNIVLYCLIPAIIKEYALLLDVLPWEQLRDGNEYVLSSDGWWLSSILWSVSGDRGVLIVAVLGSLGAVALRHRERGRCRACSSRSFFVDGNRKAAGASSASQNKAPTSLCDLSTNTILLWSVHTLLSKKTATRKKPLTSLDVLQSGSEWALLPLKGLFYPNHCPWFFLPRGNPFVLWFLKLIRFLWSDIRVFQQK